MINLVSTIPPAQRAIVDTAAGGALLLTWIGVLPMILAAIASTCAIVWYGCMITSWIVNKGWKPKQ